MNSNVKVIYTHRFKSRIPEENFLKYRRPDAVNKLQWRHWPRLLHSLFDLFHVCHRVWSRVGTNSFEVADFDMYLVNRVTVHFCFEQKGIMEKNKLRKYLFVCLLEKT